MTYLRETIVQKASAVVFKLTGLVCVTVSISSVGLAAEPRNLGWQDLLPTVTIGENPFETLDFRQRNDLTKLYRIEVKEAATASDFERSQAKDIRENLSADGLDPDWYFEQRKRMMAEHEQQLSAPNPEVLSQTVRVPGYIVPLELDGATAVEFLLVPTAGACIHTPPPPANQMILVRYPPGYPLRGLYDPVWIVGELKAETQVELVTYSDGQLNVQSSYVMTAVEVEQYK
ncbi:DUF3299 domain-containing protein [Tropicibacter sp. Alg240-R139]|uniref:DUF3299 domain-containing protein n=1 Tax=Tropicibacter sp. Alg240-R139 TaxID=2305991 RepID=UPI0013E00DC0|nr:DUF3299 domain-containing protein [Tropicibacter sp. Alg240-R139]